MSELRVFHCRHCDHHMRYPSERCGYCQAPAPFYNQGWFLVVTAGVVALVVLVVAMFMLG